MGTSHTLIKKGFELSVDESEGLFDISIGSGFKIKSEADTSVNEADTSVNIEICDLTLDQLKEVSNRLQEVISFYPTLTTAEADAAYDAAPAVPISEKEIESKDLEDILVDARNYVKNFYLGNYVSVNQAEEIQEKINLLKSKGPLPSALRIVNEFLKCLVYHVRCPNLNNKPTKHAASGIISEIEKLLAVRLNPPKGAVWYRDS